MINNRFLVFHDPIEDEILIPIDNICKVVLDPHSCSIDIYLYGGEKLLEDDFTRGAHERLERFQEIQRILNNQQEEQTVFDYITKEAQESDK